MADPAWEPFLVEFNSWYAASGGFGDYLRHFLAHYGPFFREDREEHLFVYTKLHKEFMGNLDAAVKAWYESKGMNEEQFTYLLEYGKYRGDQHTMGIVQQLTALFEYPSWIAYIFSLKKNSEFMERLAVDASPDGWENHAWTTKWWEKWSDQEWAYWEEKSKLKSEGETGHWQEWSDEDWENWWKEKESWEWDWQEKTDNWKSTWDSSWKEGSWNGTWNNDWREEAAAETSAGAPAAQEPQSLTIAVPEGYGPGTAFQVQAPDGQLVTVTVPEGIAPGGSFLTSYMPLA